MLSLKNYLSHFNFLPKTDIESVLEESKILTIKKGDYFIQEGHTCNKLAFINSGIFRSFYYSTESEETTYCFSFPNQFLSAYSSFITKTPTTENIQAITDAQIVILPISKIEHLIETKFEWMKLSKMLAEEQYIALENRIFQLQKEKAETRYKDLVNNQSELIRNIPLLYLASYLGITQRHLSRIRKEIMN